MSLYRLCFSLECCQLDNKGLAVFSFSFLFWHLEVGMGKVYQCRTICIDILILVHRLYNLIFSVPITKNWDK
jgi:hypothetical protein